MAKKRGANCLKCNTYKVSLNLVSSLYDRQVSIEHRKIARTG